MVLFQDLQYEVTIWKSLNVCRSVCAIIGWLVVAETKHRPVDQAPEKVGGSEAAAEGKLGKWQEQDMRNDIVNATEHLSHMYARFLNAQYWRKP